MNVHICAIEELESGKLTKDRFIELYPQQDVTYELCNVVHQMILHSFQSYLIFPDYTPSLK